MKPISAASRWGGSSFVTRTGGDDNAFPIRITSVAPGPGNIVADDEHRAAGCINTGVAMTKDAFEVSWNLAKNTIGAFTPADGLRMEPEANRACIGDVHGSGADQRRQRPIGIAVRVSVS